MWPSAYPFLSVLSDRGDDRRFYLARDGRMLDERRDDGGLERAPLGMLANDAVLEQLLFAQELRARCDGLAVGVVQHDALAGGETLLVDLLAQDAQTPVGVV